MAGALDAMRHVQDEYASIETGEPNLPQVGQGLRRSQSRSSMPRLESANRGTTASSSKSKRARKKPTKSNSPTSWIPPLDAILTNETSGTFVVDTRDDVVIVTGTFLGDDLTTLIPMSFQLPRAHVASDHEMPLQFPVEEMLAAQAAAVQALVHPPEVDVSTSVVRSSGPHPIFNIVVKGTVKELVAEANKLAWDAAKECKRGFLDERFYFERKKDSIAPDYDRLFKHYAPMVTSVVAALRHALPSTHTPRNFAALALAFVQSLPYERADGGYRRPLAVLTDLRGNCGSKTTLFLALVHHAYPTLDKCVCVIPNHVFAGIKLEKVEGDIMVGEDLQYVAVEPVGPGRLAVGQLRPTSTPTLPRR
ncbi:hypothetical protein DYB32_002386 [Aphanomyces invadans]|uniref:Uncharacterized protein n=1 Tax=Aphanomyces invadans TaxID=157072 RepID=A0A418B3I7_9STRA|nr:hypothetical protein DYB32_002386 [Aphanomyces invadans]